MNRDIYSTMDIEKPQSEKYSGEVVAAASQNIKEKEYWLNALAGDLEKAYFPLDYKKKAKGSSMDTLQFEIIGDTFYKLMSLCNGSDFMLHMFLLSVTTALLKRYTNSKDIIIGTPIYKQKVEGKFINTILPLRNKIEGETTFKDLLIQVRKTLIAATENQNYPIETLLYKLNLEDLEDDEFPLFDVVVLLENIHDRRYIQHIHLNMILSFTRGDSEIIGTFAYNPSLYDRATILRVISHFSNFIHQTLLNIDSRLERIDIFSKQEKRQILVEFNDTEVQYPTAGILPGLFEAQVVPLASKLSIIYEDEQLTHEELNKRANQLARVLRRKGVKANGIVGIMVERSLEMIIGMMGILKAGGAYLPIDATYPSERIKYMLEDSSVKLLLTKSHLKCRVGTQVEKINLEKKNQFLTEENSNLIQMTKIDDMAYIIYTSGSTGKQKGVVIEHRSILNTLRWRKDYYGFHQYDAILQIPSFSFDSSVEDIFTPLISGAELTLIDEENRYNIDYLGKLIKKRRITHFLMVPSFYKIFLEEDSTSLVNMKSITIAGDNFSQNLVIEHFRKLSHVKLVNEYGPTESSVCATVYEFTPEKTGIRIGKPISNMKCYILDEDGQLCPIGVSGELCISGRGLAREYLNNPRLTRERFEKKRFIEGQRLYRTGDLARWCKTGDIEFLGRIDHQVKIRGFRIEPGEIESRLLNNENIKSAVVIAKEDEKGDKYLCAYIVSAKKYETLELQKFLSRDLPNHMIPANFVFLDRMPLSLNGKIDRKSLPEPTIKKEKNYAAPTNEIEKKMVDIWADVLGQEKALIGIDTNFFDLGGHSLRATILASRIFKEFNVKLPLKEVFRGPTIKEISDIIRSAILNIFREIQPVEKKEYYPLSSAQKRLYFLQQFDHSSTGYNIALLLPLNEDFDRAKLESSVNKLIAQHESLRTSFRRVNDITVQQVHDSVKFEIEYYNLDPGYTGDGSDTHLSSAIRHLSSGFIRSFDLSQAPLLRVALIAAAENENSQLLMVDMHHIISDGTSTTVLVEDFLELYRGNRLPELKLQYKDFSQWQNSFFASGEIKVQEDYWREVYWDCGEFPRLQLPVDYKRPEVFTFDGDHLGFMMERADAFAFKAISTSNGVTLYMNFLTLLNTFFSKITSQTDIIVGTGIAGRQHADLQGIIGMFVNVLAMRNYPHGEKTYESFLKEVAAHTINAFENQDVQFEDLVEKLELQRDPSRNPLFDVSLVVQNFRKAGASDVKPGNSYPFAVQQSGFKKFSYDFDSINTTSKFDMSFFITEDGDDIEVYIEYYTAIFRKETIQRLASQFINLVKTVIKSPAVKLKDIDIISKEEKNHLLYELNDTARVYPGDKTIHELFSEQAHRTPDKIALMGMAGDLSCVFITYRQLEHEANQLANYLVSERQNRNEALLGILMERSIHQVIALLGILKSGSAYVPLDTSLPEERIKNIIDDACIEIVISQKRFIRVLNRLQWDCSTFRTFLCLDSTDIYSTVETEKSELMDTKLWDYVAESATDEITGGGWFTSYTGEPFTEKEMEEYGDNILKKLLPLLHQDMRVLEIGCGSGISMYRIAPRVGFYYATDLSKLIIANNKKRIKEEGLKNIALSALPAHEIDKLDQRDFDLVIINSVIQSFHGHNYLRQVLCKAISMLKQRGYLFIGDILDQDLKADLINEMNRFKFSEKGTSKTKTDWSVDLFVSPSFFEDLSSQWLEIDTVKFSNKIYTTENELTMFRYDTLISIDRLKKGRKRDKVKSRHKYQHDRKALAKFSEAPIEKKVNFKPGNLAYIIYTSGSTGRSKGVMITHQNVARLVKNTNYINYIDFKGGERFLLTGSFAFDVSTFEIWGLLLNGIGLYMMDIDVILDGERLRKAIIKHNISIIHFIPQLFNQHAANCPNVFEPLDCFLIGGDMVTPGAVTRVKNKFNHLKILHMYGPTENTTFSTYFPVEKDYETTIPIGRPISNTTVYILNKYHQLQPIGVVGELCTGGEGVARGYLNNPELTVEKFLHPSPVIRNSTPLYKTGDLAKWLPEGNIEFMGRVDHQVKIRGFRIETGEIESHLMDMDFIQEAVVIARQERYNDKYLCAYLVGDHHRKIDASELRNKLLKRLPNYMVPSYFITLDKIPLTPNGKVNQKALPQPGGGMAPGKSLAPCTEIEKQLVNTWSQVLGIDEENIGVDGNFFEMGGHSLKAISLISRIHKEFDVIVPLAEVFRTPTILGLAKYISQTGKISYVSIQPVEKKESYALSSAQKRLYIMQQMDVNCTAYNSLQVIPLRGKPDKERLQETFNKLIKQHENLRTSFLLIDNQPVQRIHENVEFKIQQLESALVNAEHTNHGGYEYSTKTVLNAFIKPFDLTAAPLLRAALINTADEKYMLAVDMHHIISDAVSYHVLLQDFMALYNRKVLMPLRLQYKEYSEWQREEKKRGTMKEQKNYWINRFKGGAPALNMPTDYPRPEVWSFKGKAINFRFDPELTGKIKELINETGVTLYMVLLAAIFILLSKYTRQDDVVIGSPIAGRRHLDLQNIIGMFVNMLPMRNQPKGTRTFAEFLEEVKENTLQAFKNQDYEFDELVEQLGIQGNSNRNPLFDTVFTLQNVTAPGNKDKVSEDLSDNEPLPFEYEDNLTRFDLHFIAEEAHPQINMRLEYSTCLFNKKTAQKMIDRCTNILKQVVEDRNIKLKDIKITYELLTINTENLMQDQGDFQF